MDPINVGPNPMQGLPMTDEVATTQKKARLQAGIETQDTAEGKDVYLPSQAASKLNKPKFEKFLDDVKDTILKMDRDSDTFLPDATSKLVGHALHQEFGEQITQDPGYSQMEARLTQHILSDPESREQVSNLLDMIYATAAAPPPNQS
ncbi:MAG: hypothetical protein ACYCW6_17910 [Candidatus Xenobia bacterium]